MSNPSLINAPRHVSLGRKVRTIVWLLAIVPFCLVLTVVTVASVAIGLPLVWYSAFKQHRERNPWRRNDETVF